MDLTRPQLSLDNRKRLERFLLDHYERAVRARQSQVDSKFVDWTKNYYGEPAEKIRTVPWYRSSNFVVKIVRMFVEAFVARTLNIVFATSPLFSVDGFPTEDKEAIQYYMDRKSLATWEFYSLFQRMLFRGAKNGTVVTKTVFLEDESISVQAGDPDVAWREQTILEYRGPKTKVIPFDDICLYPYTACDMSEVEMKFHRLRYTRETANRKVALGEWNLSEEDLAQACKQPRDQIKRDDELEAAGIYDRDWEELQLVECHVKKYAVTNDPNKFYAIVGLICPVLRKLVDVYFCPYPGNQETFHLYVPSPREDCIYGESWAEILSQAQEETSQIHNDRRNSSFLASAPVFKRKSGSRVPNPSTNWYPGKVFDLDEMDDFDVVSLGRDTGDMINEEMHVLSLAERLMGIGPIMQGAAMGNNQKGIYNTGGVLATMSEGNSRQDSNIRDARVVLGSIGKCHYLMQALMAPDDPALENMPPQMAQRISAAFGVTSQAKLANARFEIKASSAGANREVEKASLLQMGNFLGQYSQTILALTPQVISAQNPGLQSVLLSVLEMAGWMAKRLLSAYDESDAEGVLPDVKQILGSAGGPSGSPGSVPSAGAPNMGPPGANGAGGAVSPADLQQISQMAASFGGGTRT